MATVLIIAPHPDDEVLGAGGFIKKSHEKGDKIVVLTVSGHMPPLPACRGPGCVPPGGHDPWLAHLDDAV